MEKRDKHICVSYTPFFQSLEEKVELQLRGNASYNSKLTYVLYSYDSDEVENEVYSESVVLSEYGSFEASYSFDPISLAVYENAVKFRAKLYSETNATEVAISEFSIKEVCEVEQTAEEQNVLNSNVTMSEKGEKCVFVQQSSGEKITVPLIPQKVLFVGNSILLGMFNTYGMCASSPKKDYAYLVQQKLLEYNKDCVFYKLHGGGFEHAESMEAFEAWFSEEENVYTGMPAKESFTEDLDLIFIQLTDNVNTEAKIDAFRQKVDVFMEHIKKRCPKARIIWIHGWYNKANTLDKLIEVCDRWSLERIDISELHVKENQSYSGQISWHPEDGEMTVKDTWITHPGDKGMEKIAERIIEVLGIDINIINIINNGENATLLVKQAFSEIKDNEENIIQFETSTYYFYAEGAYVGEFYPSNNASTKKTVVFPILNRKNITIDGGGSDFVFCDRVTPFILQNSENICLRNFNIDFSFMRYCQGRVISVSDIGFMLDINKDLFRYHVENGNLLFEVGADTLSSKKRKISVKGITPKRNVCFWHVGNTEFKKNPAAPCVMVDAEEVKDGVFFRYREDSFKPAYEAGDLLCLANDNERENSGIFAELSNRIAISDISMYRCAGMGIIAQLCRDIVIDHCRVAVKENREEFYSTTADAMHFVHCDGELVIRNSVIHSAYDDALNVHGNYSVVEEVLSKHEVKIGLKHHEQEGIIPLWKDDVIYISDTESHQEKGSALVTDVSFKEDRSNIIATFVEDISKLMRKGDLLENPNRMPELLLENNIISHSPRILVATSQKTVIQNNIFNLGITDIYINDGMGFFNESGTVSDVRIVNNSFMSTKNEHSVIITSQRRGDNVKKHKNILIENNKFGLNEKQAIRADAVENLVVRNNEYKNEGPYIHHFVEIEGDYTKELKEFCKFFRNLKIDKSLSS